MAKSSQKKTTQKKPVQSVAPVAEKKATTLKATLKKSAAASSGATHEILGFGLQSWVQGIRPAKAPELKSGKRGHVFYLGRRDLKSVLSVLRPHLLPWQLESALKSESEVIHYQGKLGPAWILRPAPTTLLSQHEGQLERSLYARARDQFGSIVSGLALYDIQKLILEFHQVSLEEEKAALIGLEIGHYFYAENCGNPRKMKRKFPALLLRNERHQLTRGDILAAAHMAVSVNIARHLVNVPGGALQPKTYSDLAKALFTDSDTVTVEVWEGDKLVQERMNLLLAVGQAASQAPRLVHLRYRPKMGNGKKPIALVGKGITFDSGGLDLKPAGGMRWMKKDMGGSAALVALSYWVEKSQLPQALDFYLALAENAVSSDSFRPGDVITARNGLTIEIHNTDAEGRLVLADALDVAATQDETPSAIIDVATLTGAIKVSLGADLAGLFVNNDELADVLVDSSRQSGDLMWRMPLFQPYRGQLRSTFADLANCSDGFGGAVTAALFLESFVGKLPWAHLDIYAWKDGASGAFSESGGSGQAVQALAEALQRLSTGTTLT